MVKLTVILIMALLLVQSAQAQLSANIEMSSYADDNLFRSPEPVSDVLSNVGLTLAYRPQDSGMKFYYDGSFFMYNDFSERNFSLQALGLNSFSAFGSNDQHGFYWGTDLTMRFNGLEYKYYDYTQLYAYANLNFDLNFMFLKSGYNFRYRSYSNLPDLSNYRHYAFVQLNKSFATRTTLILEADLGHKSFAGIDLYTPGSDGGRGRGGMWSSSVATVTSTIPSMTQAVLLARITQSLHTKVGLFVQYRKQISLTSQADYQNTDGYFQDEELFDDPFSYESDALSTQLTWVLPWTMKLKIGGGSINKTYISEQAYTSAEDTVGLGGIRSDKGNNFFVSLNKTFYLKKNWLDALSVDVHYKYIRNESNSYWYDYKNAMLGAGIAWKF